MPLPTDNIPKTLLFKIPERRWRECTNVVDFDNSHLMQWCQNGKKLKDSEHVITYTAQVISGITFFMYKEEKFKEIHPFSSVKLNFQNDFDSGSFKPGRLLVQWTKEKLSCPTYLFTLLTADPPWFFKLEFETKNLVAHNEHSYKYLKMFYDTKIIDASYL